MKLKEYRPKGSDQKAAAAKAVRETAKVVGNTIQLSYWREFRQSPALA